MKLIPFTVDLRDVVRPILNYDRWLVQNEGRGILAWLVRGYLDYRKEGLKEPQCVTTATGRYRDDSDPLGDFLAEHCVDDPEGVVLASDLYRVYSESGGKWSATAFGRAMAERYQKARPNSGEYRKKTVYQGLRLRHESWDADFHETQEKQDLPTVAHSLPGPRMNLANSIEQPNNCGQLWASDPETTCNHTDPSTWIHRDGKAFCPGCDRYMGRVQAEGTDTDVAI